MSKFGIIVTVTYIALIVILRWSSFPELLSNKLNEFGDFFAGVFGPLMLFWLILGYIQQQKELRQNTAALELQAKELRNSVEQHKELVKATREQVAAELQALEIEQKRARKEHHPNFVLIGAGQSRRQGDTVTYSINFKNSGKSASNVSFHTEPYIKEVVERQPLSNIDSGTTFKAGWSNKNSCEAPEILILTLKCLDSKAESYETIFSLKMGENNQYEIESVADNS